MTFTLDPRLAQDTAFVCDWPLSGLYRMDDRRYVWIVLVPRRAEMSEPFDLPAADQALLWRETMHAAALLKRDTGCRKVNVGALGNIVTQLHVHVVARNDGDVAWPGPVWGKGAAERFGTDALNREVARLRHVFHPPTD